MIEENAKSNMPNVLITPAIFLFDEEAFNDWNTKQMPISSFNYLTNIFSIFSVKLDFHLLQMGILELKIQAHLMCKITMNKNMPKIKLFLLFMYCLIYGKILKYMSFTIFIQSSLHNKPFRNEMIQGLLFRWAICGPWASCCLSFMLWFIHSNCFQQSLAELINVNKRCFI